MFACGDAAQGAHYAASRRLRLCRWRFPLNRVECSLDAGKNEQTREEKQEQTEQVHAAVLCAGRKKEAEDPKDSSHPAHYPANDTVHFVLLAVGLP
jgi:hypothetical protein